MSDTKKPTKKVAAAPKKPAEHPKYIEMISAAIISLKERTGSSRQAILKYIVANYKVGDSAPSHIKTALRRGVTGGTLSQPKGTGASGSFKMAKKTEEKKKKPAGPKKPTVTASAKKKPAPKKKTTPKKPAKKTPKKAPSTAKKTKKQTKKPTAKKPVSKVAKTTTKKSPKKKRSAKK